MSAALMTKAERKTKRSDGRGPRCTFQDVNTLFVGWVGVGVVRRREHAAVDVADPRAAVILVRALAATIARGILKAERRQTDGLLS